MPALPGLLLPRSTRLMALLGLVLVLVCGCAANQQTAADVVTVEGLVTARGNEPFVRYILETAEGNLYALRIPEEERERFQTPARLRVTGKLYADEWQGRSFAHIDVAGYTSID